MKNSRGSVLIQVLILGLLLLVLTTALVKAVFQHFQFGYMTAASAKSTSNAEAAVSMVRSAWISTGGTCQSVGAVVCNPVGGCNCNCTATIGGTPYTVVSSGGGSDCTLTLNQTYQ